MKKRQLDIAAKTVAGVLIAFIVVLITVLIIDDYKTMKDLSDNPKFNVVEYFTAPLKGK